MNNTAIYNTNGNNGQMDFRAPQPMTTVRGTRDMVATVHGIVGTVLVGTGLLHLILNLIFDHRAAALALQIIGGVMTLNGIILMIIAACFRAAVRKEQEKRDRLRAEGINFPAEITKIERRGAVRAGYSVSVYAECAYTSHEGNVYTARSASFMYDDRKDYTAWVYINPRNPHDYAVEIFTRACSPLV